MRPRFRWSTARPPPRVGGISFFGSSSGKWIGNARPAIRQRVAPKDFVRDLPFRVFLVEVADKRVFRQDLVGRLLVERLGAAARLSCLPPPTPRRAPRPAPRPLSSFYYCGSPAVSLS